MSKFEKEQVFSMPSILISGFGIVGRHIKKEFPFASTYDKDVDMGADFVNIPQSKFDFCFICVPTPNIKDNNKCDIRYVEEVLNEIKADIYIIKSTIPPKTTEMLNKKYNKKIIFSPEFYSATNYGSNDDFVILGGEDKCVHKVRQLYELNKSSGFKIYQCKSIEAEIIKYMANCFLATKVIFCNQFKDIADLYDVDYSKIRDGLVLDKRIGESHTFVFDDYRGYDSKCLNKDIPAFITAIKERGFKNKFLLETVDEINNLYKDKTKK